MMIEFTRLLNYEDKLSYLQYNKCSLLARLIVNLRILIFEFENPSNEMQFDKPNINGSKPQLEQSFKVELLDFQGSLNPDDFVD